LGYGEARGSPTVMGDGGASWAKVDTVRESSSGLGGRLREELLVDVVPVVMSMGPGNDQWRPAPERLSYSIFTPKPGTHCMHDPGLIVSHIRPKGFIDNQLSRIKYDYYYINSVAKDYDDS
jgi:hypothetical protein